ncbi:MAG: N-acetylmuramoyl-L-alanine amidase [Ruminococcaceae bacterium]|nr:N-acetylmuramoyl-L-alanine amidase [Oscillospiraceae bacterium]
MAGKRGYFGFWALLVIMGALMAFGFYLDDSVTVYSETSGIENRKTVVIDPGHGGVDGGATSVSGVLESGINLQISLRLNDLLHLLGINTKMLRTEDVSIHTSGNTIAQKKVSDLKERVRIIENTDPALLVSIHQNYFQESKYSGAQVFYPDTHGSKELAAALQASFTKNLNPGNHRLCKPASGVYLMQKISCTGVLIECGFLSNPTEDRLLQDASYQKKLCCIIAAACGEYMFGFQT